MRGGKRKGSGRPQGSVSQTPNRVKMINVRLTVREFETLTSQALDKRLTITGLIKSKIFE